MPEIQMPKLSDTMTEGTLVAWKKKKGDKVSAGEVIAEIETDKATMEWESPEDGTLTEIYVQEGGKVNVGDKIAFIGEEGESAPKKDEKPKAEEKKQKKPPGETEKPAPAEAKEKETAPPQEKIKGAEASANPTRGVSPAKPKEEPSARSPLQKTQDEARVKASPVARRVAGELGVDLSSIKGTGPEGRVTESDVRAAAKGRDVGTAVPAAKQKAIPSPLQKREGETRIHLSGMRKGIAERLVQSLGPVPHFYLTIEVNARPLMEA
ncbi:MAG TPA: biotin/lipoyl-containing protein, partial [Chthoniobacterales bacterium]|nr:biotin/lipoyl-containing protein [Chthoniobacterales bacterium]